MLAWKSTDCHGAVFGTSERELNRRFSPQVLANGNDDRKRKKDPNGGWLPAPRPSSSPAKFWASTSGKKVARPPRLSLVERWVISLRLAGRSGNSNKNCFNLPLFHVGRDADKISVSASQRAVSVCLSVCTIRGLFLSVSLPPKLVSQLLLTPRDKAVPVVTSADTTRATHARLAHAPLAYLPYPELVGGKKGK